MKYYTTKNENGEIETTSKIIEGDDSERRIVDGVTVHSKDKTYPLIRSYFKAPDKRVQDIKGKYTLAVRNKGYEWAILKHIARPTARGFTKELVGLRLAFDEVAVIQYYDDHIWTGLDRDDPTDFGHEEQDEDEEITGEI